MACIQNGLLIFFSFVVYWEVFELFLGGALNQKQQRYLTESSKRNQGMREKQRQTNPTFQDYWNHGCCTIYFLNPHYYLHIRDEWLCYIKNILNLTFSAKWAASHLMEAMISVKSWTTPPTPSCRCESRQRARTCCTFMGEKRGLLLWQQKIS